MTMEPYLKMPYISNLKTGTLQDSLQQDGSSKDFYLSIVNKGIVKTYNCYNQAQVSNVKKNKIIIVGAGAAGLSAAFELVKAGQEVTILERQNRVGGKTKKIREGLSEGIKAEGSAMRIPRDHFLTHAYIQKFGVKLRTFNNHNPNGSLYIKGHDPITIEEWEKKNRKFSDLFFPGWDSNIPNDVKNNVKGLRDYYNLTLAPVKNELINKLGKKGIDQNEVWNNWVSKWSVMSLEDFLRTDKLQEDSCPKYRPWSDEAFHGLMVTSYHSMHKINLIEALRDELGQWWSDDVELPVEGMMAIADGFVNQTVNGSAILNDMIRFGKKVTEIKREGNGVVVTYSDTVTGKMMKMNGDAVIVTTSLPILRQMDIDLDNSRRYALQRIHCEASTQILLQYRTRFWEEGLGSQLGGFSKTNLQIGQIHYPCPNNPPDKSNKRGILLINTCGQDALFFDSEDRKEAISTAVHQVAEIHTRTEDEFEGGVMQTWSSDPSTHGVFASLLPHNYCNGLEVLMNHSDRNDPIYLAGEAISFTNGWMQGAIESGLRAAYILYGNKCIDISK